MGKTHVLIFAAEGPPRETGDAFSAVLKRSRAVLNNRFVARAKPSAFFPRDLYYCGISWGSRGAGAPGTLRLPLLLPSTLRTKIPRLSANYG